jgi:hypothetical protein
LPWSSWSQSPNKLRLQAWATGTWQEFFLDRDSINNCKGMQLLIQPNFMPQWLTFNWLDSSKYTVWKRIWL